MLFWGKLNTIIPFEWENDDAVPVTEEMQLGRMFPRSFGIYIVGLFRVGKDRPYEWGVGPGIRITY